jgi:Ca-activated chloride channel family protein
MIWGASQRLWALAALPIAAWALAALRRDRRRRLARLADPALWPELMPTLRPTRERLRDALWLGAVALLLLALARPQWGFHWEEVRRRGLQLFVALDTSNSMRAPDPPPSRLQHAQWGVRDLVRRLRGDRIGLIAFAGSAFLQCPLTSDYAAFLMTLDDVHPGLIPRGGTAIAAALREAAARFDYRGESDRVIVLITDGENHEGDLDSVIPQLQEKGIRVYAVGVGSPEGELIPLPEGGFMKDRQGRVVKTRLVEEPLKTLALKTNGAYVRAAPGDFGLERLYDEHISRLRREEREERLAKVHEERHGWFVAGALCLLALEMLIPVAARQNRTRPETEGEK